MATNHRNWWRTDGGDEPLAQIHELLYSTRHSSTFQSHDGVDTIFRRQDLPKLRVIATGTRKTTKSAVYYDEASERGQI